MKLMLREALNRPVTWLAMAGVVLLLGVVTAGWRWFAGRAGGAAPVAQPVEEPRLAAPPVASPARPMATLPVVAASANPALDKTERVKKILRDYEEIQAKMAADYGAAGQNFPGGLNAFMQQLALLEREKRADLAKVMTPRELEDYEIGDTAAGQRMRTLLDGTAATDEQRRAAFRAELEFNDQFGFTLDLAPTALRLREVARQATQEKVRAALGDDLFGAWLQRDDPGYAGMVAFVRQQSLADTAALALWRVKNDYVARKLEIEAQPDDTTEARRSDALQAARAKVIAIVGPAALESANSEVVDWLRQVPARSLPVR
jgi:hypothetical protein